MVLKFLLFAYSCIQIRVLHEIGLSHVSYDLSNISITCRVQISQVLVAVASCLPFFLVCGDCGPFSARESQPALEWRFCTHVTRPLVCPYVPQRSLRL